jgi:hypothetical protein
MPNSHKVVFQVEVEADGPVRDFKDYFHLRKSRVKYTAQETSRQIIKTKVPDKVKDAQFRLKMMKKLVEEALVKCGYTIVKKGDLYKDDVAFNKKKAYVGQDTFRLPADHDKSVLITTEFPKWMSGARFKVMGNQLGHIDAFLNVHKVIDIADPSSLDQICALIRGK